MRRRRALRPSAAHGLVWLTRPAAGDVFLDPFCGTGTLAAERAAYPHARVLACDRDGALLAPAAHGVFGADARALPLPSGGVDAVATNLPFGRQVLAPGELPDLYAAFLRELARVLRVGGRAVLLGNAAYLVPEILPPGLELASSRCVSLRGRTPVLWLVGRCHRRFG